MAAMFFHKDNKREQFDRLYLEQNSKLRSFVSKYVHDTEAIKDIIADAFVELHDKWESSPQKEALLFGIARNMAYSHVRRISVAFKHEKQYIAFKSSGVEESPSFTAEELTSLVEKAFRDVDESLRPYLYMLMDGKSQKEMETIMEVNQSTVSRNIKKVKEFLMQYSELNGTI